MKMLVQRITGDADIDPITLGECLAIMRTAVAERPPVLQFQLRLFLWFLRWCPLLAFGGRLERLNESEQEAFLTGLENAPVALVRKGFWGLKALIYMGYYGRAGAGERLGYQRDLQGNARLH